LGLHPPSRRAWRIAAWCLLLGPTAGAQPEARPARPHPPAREARGKAPNILILIGDDHAGRILGASGDPLARTPRLDRLASEGVRFSRAYCNAPVCTASRQSLITGRLPHAVGVTRLLTPLPADAVTLGDWLGDLGYDTAAYGKMHFNAKAKHGFQDRLDTPDWTRWLREHPPRQGDHRKRWRPFEDPASVWLNAACEPTGLPSEAMEDGYYVDRALEFVEQHTKSDARPFALVMGFHEPHSPFAFPDDWSGRRSASEFPAPVVSPADRTVMPKVFSGVTAEEARGIRAAYYSSLGYLDQLVGRVLDGLDRSGLSNETLVVYLGDNGYLLGEHGRFEKHCFYESAVNVPLILRWPGHVPAGGSTTEMVELVDVLPTLLELAQLPAPPDLQGKSLAPLLRGEPGAKGRDVVVSEYLENEEAMARSSRYKLIVGTGGRIRQDGYVIADPPRQPNEHLFDLEADPDENVDLIARAEHSAVADRLRHALFERLSRTRGGTTPIPAGLSEAAALRWCLVPQD
jgi:choline-sulfatase